MAAAAAETVTERGAGVTLTDSVTVDSVLTADTDDIGLCSFVV